jgi:hypothetical protein
MLITYKRPNKSFYLVGDYSHEGLSIDVDLSLGDSGDKVNAAGFSDSAIDRTVDGITYDVVLLVKKMIIIHYL